MRTSKRDYSRRIGLALIGVVLAAGPSPAFYWSLRVTPSVVNPGDQNSPGNPPTPVPGDPIQPPPNPPDTTTPPIGPTPPGAVPEPTAMAAGLIGLGIVGIRRFLRKRDKAVV